MTTHHSTLATALNEKKSAVKEARVQLNKLDEEKENWFKKKTEFSTQIKKHIEEVKTLKSKRNSLTQEVKIHKKKRRQSNRRRNQGTMKFLWRPKDEPFVFYGGKQITDDIRSNAN